MTKKEALFKDLEQAREEVNRLLVEAEVQPLTNLVDGFDENGWKVANG